MASFVYWNKETEKWEKEHLLRHTYARNSNDGQLWIKSDNGKWVRTDTYPLPLLVQGDLFNG